MVEVRYRGSFGDNLFQYCFGRLLAERWGHQLKALPLPHFPATAESVQSVKYLSPFLSWSGMAVEERQLGMLLATVRWRVPRGGLVLYGWFQRWEYFPAGTNPPCGAGSGPRPPQSLRSPGIWP